MNIYIYGTDKFKNNIKSILTKANLGINIEFLNTLFAIKTKLEMAHKDIFIVDETKIISENFFTKRMRFIYPTDVIERGLIEKYGVGDVCFNSINGMIGYINSRLQLEEKESKKVDKIPSIDDNTNPFETMKFKNVYEDDDYEYDKEDNGIFEDMIVEEEVRDCSTFKTIEEIRENEIEDGMFLHLKV